MPKVCASEEADHPTTRHGARPRILTPGHSPGDLLSRQRRSHLSPASCVSGHRCPKFVQSRGTLTPPQTHGARSRIQVPRTWGAPHRDRWRSWLSHASRSTSARTSVEARRHSCAIQRERCELHEGTPMQVNPVTKAKPSGLVQCHQTCPHRRAVGVRLLQPCLVERTGRAAQHRADQSRHARKARRARTRLAVLFNVGLSGTGVREPSAGETNQRAVSAKRSVQGRPRAALCWTGQRAIHLAPWVAEYPDE
jgi:hypothetical protein